MIDYFEVSAKKLGKKNGFESREHQLASSICREGAKTAQNQKIA